MSCLIETFEKHIQNCLVYIGCTQSLIFFKCHSPEIKHIASHPLSKLPFDRQNLDKLFIFVNYTIRSVYL